MRLAKRCNQGYSDTDELLDDHLKFEELYVQCQTTKSLKFRPHICRSMFCNSNIVYRLKMSFRVVQIILKVVIH